MDYLKHFQELKNLGHDVLGIDLKEEIPKDILVYLKEDHEGQFHPYYSSFQPEYIFHLACIPRVAYSVEEPIKTMENNVLATSYVLNFARKNNVKISVTEKVIRIKLDTSKVIIEIIREDQNSRILSGNANAPSF